MATPLLAGDSSFITAPHAVTLGLSEEFSNFGSYIFSNTESVRACILYLAFSSLASWSVIFMSSIFTSRYSPLFSGLAFAGRAFSALPLKVTDPA